MDEEYRRYAVVQARRYMQHVRSLAHTVRMIKSEIDELRDLADGIGGVDYARPSVAAMPNVDAVPDAVARLQSLTAEYEAELSDYIAEQREAHACLLEVDGVHAMLLTLRYVEGKTWVDVADAMGYSEDHVRKDLHEDALAALYQHIPHMWRDPIYPAM